MPTFPPSPRTLALWRSRLSAGLRPALACALVACATFYGPQPLRRLLTFHAFSYVVVILVVNEATVGDVLRSVVYGVYGTVQGVCPAILSLWAIGPTRLCLTTTTLAVSVSAFVVLLPGPTTSTILAKRVALGQIVLIYVVAYMRGPRTDAILHPVEVAIATAVGLVASVLAVLLPFPSLGYSQVKKKTKVYTELASKKLKLFSAAFCAESRTSAAESINQARALDHTGKKLLQITMMKQESMLWERPTIRFAPANLRSPSDRIQKLEMPLQGMNLALTSCLNFPTKDEQLKQHVIILAEGISLQLKQMHCSQPRNPSNAPEMPPKELLSQSPQVSFPTIQDLPSHFFLFCMRLLHDELLGTPTVENSLQSGKISAEEATIPSNQNMPTSFWATRISGERLLIAFKCSLALGLAALFGLLFSKDNGFWAALGLAISISPCREATWKAANVRAQGTVLGSVYGILGCFIPGKNMELRFLVFLPWVIFTSFLKNSKMYGQAGGISATIAAILILGRRDYGSPSEFAIARITETFIGLSCSIFVELLLQPVRASSLAKRQLSISIGALHECIRSMAFDPHSGKLSTNMAELKETRKKLRDNVVRLGGFIEEAESEPNFWFAPFQSACYRRLLGSMSKMVDLLAFEMQAIESLEQGYQRFGGADWKNMREHLNGDLEHFKKAACTPLKCFEEITGMKSLWTEKEKNKDRETCDDIETGKAPKAGSGCRDLGFGDEGIEGLLSCFLGHARDSFENVGGVEGKEEMKRSLILCIGAMGFCMENVLRETNEIVKGVKELVQLENPTVHVFA